MDTALLTLFGITITGWKIIGYLGVTVFTMRWLVQLYTSRKAGRPVLTRWFWLFSLIGSLLLLLYFTLGKNDSVGLISNLFPAFIALYNLLLDINHEKTKLTQIEKAANSGEPVS